MSMKWEYAPREGLEHLHTIFIAVKILMSTCYMIMTMTITIMIHYCFASGPPPGLHLLLQARPALPKATLGPGAGLATAVIARC